MWYSLSINKFKFSFCFFLILSFFLYHSNIKAATGRDTTFKLNNTLVTIHYPALQVRGAILMLPGWNFSRDNACKNTSFCEKALKCGYVLICPEMGKSLYASSVFPVTRKDWLAFPQLKFITDTLQLFVQQKYSLLKKGQSNFIYGISTGARGGAIILENTDGIYTAGALLSGDYDQTLNPGDNLINGFYGSYKDQKERWEGRDNPAKNAVKIKASLYLGHGKNDCVVSVLQTENFSKALEKSGQKIILSTKENFGHDYLYWESETDAILKYFDSHL